MKRIITLMGVLGVASMFYACSKTTGLTEADKGDQTAQDTKLSSAKNTSVASSSSKKADTKPGSSTSKKDTVTITTVISGSSTYEDPYFSSGIFCWTPGCEVNFSSAADSPNSSADEAPASSAAAPTFTISSESVDPPKIEGNKLIDTRDNNSYVIEELAGKMWMTENLKFKTSFGSFCEGKKNGEQVNACDTYGMFYTHAAAKKACPGGWRLPTQAEVTALDAAVEQKWWQIGGRFKLSGDEVTEYGLDEEQGYIWVQLQDDNAYTSFRIKNYSDSDLHEFQDGSTADRAYNVRCVQE